METPESVAHPHPRGAGHGGWGRGAFTLLELLASMAVILTLAALSLAGLGQMRSIAQGAHCANSLRQLGGATALYLGDHKNQMFPYRQPLANGVLWYFGFETTDSMSEREGTRTVDVTQAPIYPYVLNVGGVEVCPSFPYGSLSLWKPKYTGASWGYGFNNSLGGKNAAALQHPGRIILFGDCAQVNTFQAPATPAHPMLEEFYLIDTADSSIHFRHGGHANMLFLDGHVESFSLWPGTLDTRLPGTNVGRITPVNSDQYLVDTPASPATTP